MYKFASKQVFFVVLRWKIADWISKFFSELKEKLFLKTAIFGCITWKGIFLFSVTQGNFLPVLDLMTAVATTLQHSRTFGMQAWLKNETETFQLWFWKNHNTFFKSINYIISSCRKVMQGIKRDLLLLDSLESFVITS